MLQHLARPMKGGFPSALNVVHLCPILPQLLLADLEVCLGPALADSVGWRVLRGGHCMSVYSPA